MDLIIVVIVGYFIGAFIGYRMDKHIKSGKWGINPREKGSECYIDFDEFKKL